MSSNQLNMLDHKSSRILIRIASEIFLKGKNQNSFLTKLRQNIKKITHQSQVNQIRGRMSMPFFEEHQKLKRVFGIHSYSFCYYIERSNLTPEQLLTKVKEIASNLLINNKGTFLCQTKRSDKTFPLTSIQINHQIGEHIEKNNDQLTFKLKNSDYILGVEINEKQAFVYKDKINCARGLPAGVEGRAAIILNNEISALSALLMIKRGVAITIIKNKSTKQQDLDFVQAYYPRPLKIMSTIEQYQLSCDNRPCVIVSSKTIKELQIKPEETTNKSLTYLYPLCSYTKEQINQEVIKYKNFLN